MGAAFLRWADGGNRGKKRKGRRKRVAGGGEKKERDGGAGMCPCKGGEERNP